MRTIKFLNAAKPASFTVIGLIVLLWIATFMRGGFNLGVDFKAGLNQTVAIASNPATEEVKAALEALDAEVKSGENAYIITVPETEEPDFYEAAEKAIQDLLSARFTEIETLSSEYVGSSLSNSLARGAIFLTLGALALIVVYLAIRFKSADYSASAIIGTLHDVLFVLGFIGAFQLEVNSATIAAILTIVGYSLNDTIVIFDRIRENRELAVGSSLNETINISISQTMSRTVITSSTTLLAIAPLIFLALGSVQMFAIEMAVGVFVGTFSSIFICSVSLNGLHKMKAKKAAGA